MAYSEYQPKITSLCRTILKADNI